MHSSDIQTSDRQQRRPERGCRLTTRHWLALVLISHAVTALLLRSASDTLHVGVALFGLVMAGVVWSWEDLEHFAATRAGFSFAAQRKGAPHSGQHTAPTPAAFASIWGDSEENGLHPRKRPIANGITLEQLMPLATPVLPGTPPRNKGE